MAYVFGPVPSRRLGSSLGVDLIPPKTCTYDCLYCQIGKTTRKTVETAAYVDARAVIEELKVRLGQARPDAVTFSGSGEPTLHSGIHDVLAFLREKSDVKTVILTNGSLLWRARVRQRVLQAHIVMPTLSTVSEETFQIIHRPHPEITASRVIEGLEALRREYAGDLHLEVMLLRGINDSDREVEALGDALGRISPDRIQLNTVVRPPSDSTAFPLDIQRLEEIKNFFGPKAEIIAGIPRGQWPQEHRSHIDAILDMARRRPMRVSDMARALNVPLEEVEGIVKGLTIKGSLSRKEHSGEDFYVC